MLALFRRHLILTVFTLFCRWYLEALGGQRFPSGSDMSNEERQATFDLANAAVACVWHRLSTGEGRSGVCAAAR